MIFPRSFSLAFVATAVVNAGPCRPSSSGSIETSSLESTAILTQTSETATATVSESEILSTTYSSVTETSTIVQSDETTRLTITISETPTAVTTTDEPTTTSEALEITPAQCADLTSPYIDQGFQYNLRCNAAWDSYQDLEYYAQSTMENCIKACSQNDNCNYAQFDSRSKLCILIGTGFDYSSNASGVSNAEKIRPA